jgi:hypothetical protein
VYTIAIADGFSIKTYCPPKTVANTTTPDIWPGQLSALQDGYRNFCLGFCGALIHYYLANYLICGPNIFDTPVEIQRRFLTGYSVDHAGGFDIEVSGRIGPLWELESTDRLFLGYSIIRAHISTRPYSYNHLS